METHLDALVSAITDHSRNADGKRFKCWRWSFFSPFHTEICQSVGVCRAAPAKSVALLPLTKLVAPIAQMKLMTSPLKKLVPAVAAPKAENGLGCTICTLLVGFAEDKLGSNATLAEIETFLNTTVCHLLPSFLRPECQSLVDEYAPQIAQKIFQGYPASVVCKDIGLCSTKLKQLIASKAQNGIGCTVCTLIIGYVEDKIGSNSTLAEIEHFLNTTACGLLPSFLKPECQTLVDEYAPQIAQKISQGYPAAVVCKDIGVCSSMVAKPVALLPLTKLVKPMIKLVKPIAQMELLTAPLLKLVPIVAAPKSDQGIVCTICSLIVGFAEDRLETNATLAEIETFLNTTVCGLLPGFLKPECQTLINEYAPQIAQKIFQGYPASVVCKDIGLCTSAKQAIVAAKTQNGIVCTICTLIVGYTEDRLGSNSSIAEIEHFLNTTVCGFLPSFLRPECQSLVDEYAPQIAVKIFQGHPASVVCKDIGLCTSAKPIALLPLTKLVKPMIKLVAPIAQMKLMTSPLKKLVPAVAAPKAENGLGCTICTLLVGFAEDKLGSNATLAEIETFLNTTVCHLLPSFLRPECQSLVDEYAPQIAQKIFQGYPASVVCKDIGLCSTKLKQLIAAKTQNGIVCTICTLIVGYTEDRLGSNSSIAEIEHFLNTTVCGFLPSFLQGECATLVDEYAPQIAVKIFQGHPASVVCKDIGLCTSAKPIALLPLTKLVKPMIKLVKPIAQMELLTAPLKKLVPAVAVPHKEANGIECLVCRLVVNAAEEEAANAATVAELESFINSTVCTVLPRLFRPECATLVDAYLPNIVAHVLASDNATVVCSALHVC